MTRTFCTCQVYLPCSDTGRAQAGWLVQDEPRRVACTHAQVRSCVPAGLFSFKPKLWGVQLEGGATCVVVSLLVPGRNTCGIGHTPISCQLLEYPSCAPQPRPLTLNTEPAVPWRSERPPSWPGKHARRTWEGHGRARHALVHLAHFSDHATEAGVSVSAAMDDCRPSPVSTPRPMPSA